MADSVLHPHSHHHPDPDLDTSRPPPAGTCFRPRLARRPSQSLSANASGTKRGFMPAPDDPDDAPLATQTLLSLAGAPLPTIYPLLDLSLSPPTPPPPPDSHQADKHCQTERWARHSAASSSPVSPIFAVQPAHPLLLDQLPIRLADCVSRPKLKPPANNRPTSLAARILSASSAASLPTPPTLPLPAPPVGKFYLHGHGPLSSPLVLAQ